MRHLRRWLCGAGFQGTEIQKRSYPNSFGGQFQNRGYELIEELKLLEHARDRRSRPWRCTRRINVRKASMIVVLDSSQLGLQIHESVGHPIELDRVLGMEANFAGTSFLTLDKLGKLRYGSDIVNVVADATEAHGPGLGTFAYDDEGVAAQCTPIITNGLFTGYLTSRDTAQPSAQRAADGMPARRRLEPPAHRPHDQCQHSCRANTPLTLGAADRVHRPWHLYGDQPLMVD